MKNKKLIAFSWYGGKFSHLDWILPLLPKTYHFVDGNGEMSHDDHIELLESLKRISGKFAISGYASNLYDDKLSKYYRYEALPKKTSVANGKRTSRVEVLWINYNPNDGQMEFF